MLPAINKKIIQTIKTPNTSVNQCAPRYTLDTAPKKIIARHIRIPLIFKGGYFLMVRIKMNINAPKNTV